MKLVSGLHLVEGSPPPGELIPPDMVEFLLLPQCIALPPLSNLAGCTCVCAAAGSTDDFNKFAEARGWAEREPSGVPQAPTNDSESSGAPPAPTDDMIAMPLPLMHRLHMEAAALGSMLFEAERAAEAAGYQLTLREL